MRGLISVILQVSAGKGMMAVCTFSTPFVYVLIILFLESARPSFRSGLSQPSQMGNFRHQSIRTTDRTGEKELERERERDLRDREGQERLRNVGA